MATSEYSVPVERGSRRPIPLHRPAKEFQELVRLDYGRCQLDDLTLPEALSLELGNLVQEQTAPPIWRSWDCGFDEACYRLDAKAPGS